MCIVLDLEIEKEDFLNYGRAFFAGKQVLAGNTLVSGKNGAGQSTLEGILGQVSLLHCPK